MIIDLNEANTNPFQDKVFDVCICGAGFAGITLALKLSRTLNVALLEAGGLQFSGDSQSVYQGNIVGHEYFPLIATRLRYFGGTSNHWTGWCYPLDPYDFDTRPGIQYSGWPITHQDLAPYLDETKSILNITKKNQHRQTTSQKEFEGILGKSRDFKQFRFWWSIPPTRMGQIYKDQIEHTPGLTCFLNANITDITLTENLDSVKEIEVSNYHGGNFKARARKFVLAAGGIENPRILLNCDRQVKGGIGNQNGLVGRFFCDHPHNTVGEFILEDSAKALIADQWTNPFDARSYFAPTREFMKREKIMNFGLRFEPHSFVTDSNFKGKLRDILCGSEWTQDLYKSLHGDAIDCPLQSTDGNIRIVSEQALNPSSRVSLGTETDRFGMRRTALDWRVSRSDKQTIKSAAIHFGQTFANLGLGRVRMADWLMADDPQLPGLAEDEVAGHHHLCTTRMAQSPSEGVVDQNQKIFGIDNFYLAGSSVFSTAGHANPTFTIVQMTLRLADHLNSTG